MASKLREEVGLSKDIEIPPPGGRPAERENLGEMTEEDSWPDAPTSPAQRFKKERAMRKAYDDLEVDDGYEMSLNSVPHDQMSEDEVEAARLIAQMQPQLNALSGIVKNDPKRQGMRRGSNYRLKESPPPQRKAVRRTGAPIVGKQHNSVPLDAEHMALDHGQLQNFRRELRSRGSLSRGSLPEVSHTGFGNRVRNTNFSLTRMQKMGRRASLEEKIRSLDHEIDAQKHARRASMGYLENEGSRPGSRARQYVPGKQEMRVEARARLDAHLAEIGAPASGF